jgi:hypothetical protein
MFDGVKVFSATKFRDRDALGQVVEDWLSRNDVEIVDKQVRQSSDNAFHCLTIVLFYRR